MDRACRASPHREFHSSQCLGKRVMAEASSFSAQPEALKCTQESILSPSKLPRPEPWLGAVEPQGGEQLDRMMRLVLLESHGAWEHPAGTEC